MKLIVGLGNPGKEYEATRHNAGWMVVDELANKLEAGAWTSNGKVEAEMVESATHQHPEGVASLPTGRQAPTRRGVGARTDTKLLLVKPTTFMNNSGRAVEAIRAYYKIDAADIIVVHDELDLPLGTVRTRLGGTSAGHNGIGSLIHHLGTDQFWRVRVGIETDHPQRVADPAGFVLASFTKEEQPLASSVVDETASHLVDWLRSGSIAETSLTVE